MFPHVELSDSYSLSTHHNRKVLSMDSGSLPEGVVDNCVSALMESAGNLDLSMLPITGDAGANDASAQRSGIVHWGMYACVDECVYVTWEFMQVGVGIGAQDGV